MDQQCQQIRQGQETDFSWMGDRLEVALKGRCPFCHNEIDFCSIDKGKPHRCTILTPGMNSVEIKEFSETEIMLIGPGYFICPAAERIQKKHPEVRIAIVMPPAT